MWSEHRGGSGGKFENVVWSDRRKEEEEEEDEEEGAKKDQVTVSVCPLLSPVTSAKPPPFVSPASRAFFTFLKHVSYFLRNQKMEEDEKEKKKKEQKEKEKEGDNKK
ncbi:hypothetical protein E2C01_048453 [Portunus trituberculatus]|uniref:Uncharacterized protein n=1 Tax=Portunus trituberculatus TaxID=210409 RepID=A0A5B7G6G3_PORTR|nr:hypothetical protein [Portunus trituberculatus]